MSRQARSPMGFFFTEEQLALPRWQAIKGCIEQMKDVLRENQW